MRVIDPEGRVLDGDSASPGSVATDDITPTPPSPCLHDLDDDDATPRQQWSPVHALVRARTHPNNGGYNGSTFTGPRSSSGAGRAKSRGGVRGRGVGGDDDGAFAQGDAAASREVGDQKVRVARPDSPVMRVDLDLERLDLSVLAMGEERGLPVGPGELNPDTFRSEPGLGYVGLGGRPRSLGGRPSRAHALFVAPGHLGAGPSSPPSSYSTHSESGFASPTRRIASPGLPREQGRVRKGHWKKGKPIGVGSCGNVYLGMNEDTGELMAVKEITLEAKERLLCSLYNEIQVMHKLIHPHIVGYLGAELQDSQRKLCIFQEWVPAGSLHSLLDQFGSLSDAMTRKYTGQVLEGLTYLHANRVIHRDVKSKNILVDDRGNVKLADFGCALVLKDDNHRGDGVEMSMKGTPLFMAPEMLLKRKCGRRVDVWSLGCAVLEMVTTRPPWADTFKHPVEIIAHFSENPGPPPLPSDLAPGLRQFLLACFTWDAQVRPSAQELCGHRYLRTPAGPAPGEGVCGPGDDIPLEEMDRASAVTRMRRCSSATLDLLAVQARQAALGVSIGGALAAFGTAPSGTFRPPSPRYGPGGIAAAAHSKRTPTRRRVYTESGMPPPESSAPVVPSGKAAAAASAAAAAAIVAGGAGSVGGGLGVATSAAGHAAGGTYGAEHTRRVSMSGGRSPPISPDKPRRPGRGSSSGALSAQAEEEGRIPGAHLASRLRTLGAVEGGGGSGGGGGCSIGCSRSSRSVSSSGDSSALADSVSASGGSIGVAEGVASGPSAAADAPAGVEEEEEEEIVLAPAYGDALVARKAAPTPRMPPLAGDILAANSAGKAGGGGAAAGDGEDPAVDNTPPPTVLPLEVRPLEIRRSVSAQTGVRPSWQALTRDADPARLLGLQQRGRSGGAPIKGIWEPTDAVPLSDKRGGGGGGDESR